MCPNGQPQRCGTKCRRSLVRQNNIARLQKPLHRLPKSRLADKSGVGNRLCRPWRTGGLPACPQAFEDGQQRLQCLCHRQRGKRLSRYARAVRLNIDKSCLTELLRKTRRNGVGKPHASTNRHVHLFNLLPHVTFTAFAGIAVALSAVNAAVAALTSFAIRMKWPKSPSPSVFGKAACQTINGAEFSHAKGGQQGGCARATRVAVCGVSGVQLIGASHPANIRDLTMTAFPHPDRYQHMQWRRSGRSGLKLPAISLGLWHNFGDNTQLDVSRQLLRHAFDHGITHFDLANNYGPPPGSAEVNFGRIMREDFQAHRDELIISTKAGYTMWEGPYGDWGSRKYLVASLDQSLRRMGLEYVDIFYHHRPDPDTPLEETMRALDHVVRQGKALYAAISNYPAERAADAMAILRDLGTPCLIHQPRYSLFERTPEQGLLQTLDAHGAGCIAFSPLAGGVLTDRYLQGIPQDSRVASGSKFLNESQLTDEKMEKVRRLNAIAQQRGQKLAQMALTWVLRDPRITSVLIGASKTAQIDDALQMLSQAPLRDDELAAIESALL
nr:L-glyceraldehyde 3-phosphate reductase [Ipomoea batatas]